MIGDGVAAHGTGVEQASSAMALMRFHRLPTRHRGGRGVNQTSDFVDAFAGIKQRDIPADRHYL